MTFQEFSSQFAASHLILSLMKMLPQDTARLEREGLTGDLTTSQVAEFFRSRAEEVPDYCLDYFCLVFPDTWAPAAASHSFARVTMGGDLPSPHQPTDDEGNPLEFYDWYNLDQVRVGGLIYRVTSLDTVYVFVRTVSCWVAYCVANLPV